MKSLSGGILRSGEDTAHKRYGICPVFGKGEILHFQWEDMEMIISRLDLRQDIVLEHGAEDDCLQLSFLMEGEKVITPEHSPDLVQVKGESYLASLRGFRGKIRLGCEKPFVEFKIRFAPSVVSDRVLTEFRFTRELSAQDQIRPISRELFTILVDLECQDLSSPIQWIFLRAKALELLALQLQTTAHNSPEKGQGYGSMHLRKLYHVRKRICDNLQDNYALSELAAEAGIPASLLNEEFTQAFGMSVKAYGTQMKMERARQMLEQTDRLIYEIAEAVGYKNATHFTAAFRRYFGQTPRQHRQLS